MVDLFFDIILKNVLNFKYLTCMYQLNYTSKVKTTAIILEIIQLII